MARLAAREGLGRLQRLVDQELGNTIPYWMDFRLSFQTALFVAGLVALAAMLAGVVPALWATGRWRQSGLHAQGATTGLQLGKTWTALVVAQVALSTAVLPVVGKFTWLDRRSKILGSGIDFDEFLTANLTMRGETRPGTEADPREFASRFGAFQTELVRQLAVGPGVSGATVSRTGPGNNMRATIEVDEVNGVGPEPFTASYNLVDAFFFDIFGFRLLTGPNGTRPGFVASIACFCHRLLKIGFSRRKGGLGPLRQTRTRTSSSRQTGQPSSSQRVASRSARAHKPASTYSWRRAML